MPKSGPRSTREVENPYLQTSTSPSAREGLQKSHGRASEETRRGFGRGYGRATEDFPLLRSASARVKLLKAVGLWFKVHVRLNARFRLVRLDDRFVVVHVYYPIRWIQGIPLGSLEKFGVKKASAFSPLEGEGGG